MAPYFTLFKFFSAVKEIGDEVVMFSGPKGSLWDVKVLQTWKRPMSFGHFGPWSIGEWYILSYCGQSCRLGLQHLRYKYVTFRSLRPPFSKTKGSLFLRDLKLKDGRSKTYVTCSLVTCKMSPTVYLFVCSFVYVFTYLINSLFTYPFSLFL